MLKEHSRRLMSEYLSTQMVSVLVIAASAGPGSRPFRCCS